MILAHGSLYLNLFLCFKKLVLIWYSDICINTNFYFIFLSELLEKASQSYAFSQIAISVAYLLLLNFVESKHIFVAWNLTDIVTILNPPARIDSLG